MYKPAFQKTPLAQGIALALGLSTLAPGLTRAQEQQPVEQPAGQPVELEEVVVTGIRASWESSMDIKRGAQGVVDSISAEDIGKFPDTNLAESLQRIPGVSIDRVGGEGARITVRGVGPDYNLVLLNGRQMPASRIEETTASNSRAFDFANLASEAIAGVDVYKTSRAEIPTGGIGATVNIRTTRPLDDPRRVLSFGVKGVMDESTEEGDSITPEVSGIYSDTFADGKFGIAITGSYQDRDLGYNQAAVANGWPAFMGDEGGWGTIPQPGAAGSENITNRPGPDDLYSVPQNLLYSFNEVQRERTNGQLTLQFRPIDSLTATLDYTYSELKLQQQRNELSAWFNFGPSVSSWTDGPVAAPIIYSEIINPATSDIAMAGAEYGSKNENKSTGFNVAWEATDRLGFEFDYHNSSAESGRDSPYGTNSALGTACFCRGTTTADFSSDFPVLSIELPAGMTELDPSLMITTGSSFRNSYMKSEVEQARLGGTFAFNDDSSLDFGVMLTTVDNRSAFANVQQDNWGGSGVSADDYPDEIWRLTRVQPYFDNMPGNKQNIFDQFFRWDFETVRAIAAETRANESTFLPSDDFTTDRRTEEETTSAYLQYKLSFDLLDRPSNLTLGMRYEQTDVTSKALVPIATGLLWTGDTEVSVLFSDPGFTKLTGDYDYFLPSLDFNVEVVDDVIARASYSQTIGRPGWGDIQGGQTLTQLARITGGTGQQGSPGLEPLLSDNFDLSVEWYYAPGSYLSVAYFVKNVDNYVGITTIQDTPFDLPNPGAGERYQEALAAVGNNLKAIKDYIFRNYGDTPEVTVRGVDAQGYLTGDILGIAGEDPALVFNITVPSNQKSAQLDGWEFAVQHVFGDSGFGASANLTLVDSNRKYNNYLRNEQFAIEGLSDSANVVGFYEKHDWQVRLAYNWRDEFLTTRYDGNVFGQSAPTYTDAYGQLDAFVGYNVTDSLNVFVEGINLTDEIQRQHGRADGVARYVTQTGARYMIGARYTFGK
jgi:TonB-dependent receptor